MTQTRPIIVVLVHSLTASGALIALMGLEAVYGGRWEEAFLWLGLALIVDGLDGPIARSFNIDTGGRFSGARIDLVVDYLNYVFVPAVALAKSGLLPVPHAQLLAGLIVMTSLYHFSDTRSKADDNSFIGFPAIWNVVIFYIFVFQPSAGLAITLIAIFIGLTFVPLRWSHPVRNVRLRPLTMGITALAAGAAISILNSGFQAEALAARAILALAALYGLALVVLNRWRADK